MSKMPKRKPGRRKMPLHKKKSDRFHFVMEPAKRQRYETAAVRAELDLSEWIRRLCDAECDRLKIE